MIASREAMAAGRFKNRYSSNFFDVNVKDTDNYSVRAIINILALNINK